MGQFSMEITRPNGSLLGGTQHKEIREARARGEQESLTPDELAFYDALADNDSAVQVMGNDQLKVIAHELLKSLQSNITIDWAHRESARARLRTS